MRVVFKNYTRTGITKFMNRIALFIKTQRNAARLTQEEFDFCLNKIKDYYSRIEIDSETLLSDYISKYNPYVTELLVRAIVMATDEFKRVYGIAAMYPDVALSVFQQVFSNALYENKPQADILDFYKAIMTSRKIYPDSIIKELDNFRETFKDLCVQENVVLPVVTIDDLEKDQTQI